MAAAWSSVGLVAVASLVVGIVMPAAAAAAAQPPEPAPAPTSDGVFCKFVDEKEYLGDSS